MSFLQCFINADLFGSEGSIYLTRLANVALLYFESPLRSMEFQLDRFQTLLSFANQLMLIESSHAPEGPFNQALCVVITTRDSSKRNKDIAMVALAQRIEDLDRDTTIAARAQTDRIEDLNRAVCYVGEQGRMNAGGAFHNQRARTMHPGQQERKTMGQPGMCYNFAKGHCPRGQLCGYRHDNNQANIGAPPSMPTAAAAAAPPYVPPSFKPSPPSTPFPGLQGSSQMNLRSRPNLPADACIDYSRGECLRAVCKFKHYPK